MRICFLTLDFPPFRSSGLAVYAETLVTGFALCLFGLFCGLGFGVNHSLEIARNWREQGSEMYGVISRNTR